MSSNQISFKNDYSEGCHPRILDNLILSNMEMEEGYGLDSYSIEARNIIAQKVGVDEDAVYFIPIGTQTNLLALSAFVQPYEYIMAAESGHIVYVEAGAIESTGRKIIHLSTQVDGKIRTEDLDVFFGKMEDLHNLLTPRLLYISNTTEVGGVYQLSELKALYAYCQKKGLLLYLDGARLASAMAASDLTFSDLGKYTDAFYIGATKAGGMMGEALVVVNPNLRKGFSILQKQKGATLAKGRFLGVQFSTLLKDELFIDLAKHANKMASKLAQAIKESGFYFMTEPQSNQLFPIFPNVIIAELSKKYAFYTWKKIDHDFSAIRLITSWATKEENVELFIADLKSLT